MSTPPPASEGVSEDEICRRWPLHWLVWSNDHRALDRLLTEKEHDHEAKDPRGRTPLHLAVTLGYVKCAEVLLGHGANVLALNRHQWSVLNEAVCTGNPELIGMVLRYRDQRHALSRSQDIPLLLERLQSTPDYYIEMKWEFSSWVPLLSRMCPSDTYKIWKKGPSVRVDTTLIGFQNFTWQRGLQTLIFTATATGHRVCEIDHDRHTVWDQVFQIKSDAVQTLMSQELGVLQRMNSPVVTTFLDTDSIAFQRQKAGIWGFRAGKAENISGYDAKVFSASGLDVVTRSRVEHLPQTEKTKHKIASPIPSISDFLGSSQDQPEALPPPDLVEGGASQAPLTPDTTPRLSMEEYFTPPSDPKECDAIGRPIEVNDRVQKLKATVWLAEGFPLSLQEQIMPIIELMALNNAHFAKLKDFITLQMPAGFPIKFEIPIFHVMSAKVTFGNMNGHTQPAPHVSLHTERVRVEPQPTPTPSTSTGAGVPPSPPPPPPLILTERGRVKHRHTQAVPWELEREHADTASAQDPPSATMEQEICTISDECFATPSGYRHLNRGYGGLADEEEELLQLAIQQSLLEQEERGGAGNEQMTLREALNDQTVTDANNPEMQSAIRASLDLPSSPPPSTRLPVPVGRGGDMEIELALALSRQQLEEDDRRRREEEEELEIVLRLSLEDK